MMTPKTASGKCLNINDSNNHDSDDDDDDNNQCMNDVTMGMQKLFFGMHVSSKALSTAPIHQTCEPG